MGRQRDELNGFYFGLAFAFGVFVGFQTWSPQAGLGAWFVAFIAMTATRRIR